MHLGNSLSTVEIYNRDPVNSIAFTSRNVSASKNIISSSNYGCLKTTARLL